MHAPAGSQALGQSKIKGIGYGAGAGALWGLVFLAPKLVPQFNGIAMASGRYLAYGLISAALLLPRWRAVRASIGPRDWLDLVWLAFLGNSFYYILLSTAVQAGGIAMTTLIIGFLPVVVTIAGTRDHGAVPLRKLAPALLLCAAGIVCIGGQAVFAPVSAAGTRWLGLLCAIGALASWAAYAVGNSRCLARLHSVSSDDWNLLTGVVTGVQAVLLLPPALAFDHGAHTAVEWSCLAAVSVGIAIVASIGGNALWNRMSRLLPLTLAGQMILFETLFALTYGFIWERRLPTLLEIAAFACVVLGVTLCIAAHRMPPVVREN